MMSPKGSHLRKKAPVLQSDDDEEEEEENKA